MTVALSLLAAATALALLELWLIPRSERRCREDHQLSVVRRSARLSVLYVVRAVLWWASIAFTFLFLASLATRFVGGYSADSVRTVIPRLERVHDLLGKIKPLWCAALISVTTPILCWLAYRSTRRFVSRQFEAGLRRDLERLRVEHESGAWESLAPTPEMKQLDTALAETLRVLQRIESIDMPAEARRAQLSRLEAKSTALVEQRQKLDIIRRVAVKVDLDSLIGSEDAGFFSRWFAQLTASRASRHLPKIFRWVFLLAVLVLGPAWVGVEAQALRTAIDKRIVSIHSHAAASGEREAMRKVRSTGNEPDDWEDTDEDIADELSREFEQAMGALLLPPRDPELARIVTREAILGRFARESTDRVELVASFQEAPDLPPEQKETLDLLRLAKKEPGPQTTLGRRFKADLKNSAQGSKKTWRRFRRTIEDGDQTFSEPFAASQVGQFSAVQAYSAAINSDPLPSSLAAVADRLRQEVGTEPLTRAFDLKSAQFKTKLVETQLVSEAAAAVAKSSGVWRSEEIEPLNAALDTLPRAERMLPALKEYPPSVRSRPDPGVNFTKAAEVIDGLRRRSGRSVSPDALDRLTDATASFDDWFPAQRGSHLRTPRGLLLSHLTTLPAAADPYSRSRVFAKLAEAARVNGIVLGAPASGELDIRQLNWDLRGRRVSLVVQRADGQAIWVGEYPKNLIWQALAFAADGRQLLISKTEAAPLIDRRVLLHPALRDTPLGCRMLTLSEAFEDYALTEHGVAIITAEAHHALYKYAWAVRAMTLAKANELRGGGKEPPIWLRDTAASYLADPVTRVQAERALDGPGALKDSERSPLAARLDVYDRELIEFVQGCASATGGLPSFGECVARSARRWFDTRPAEERGDWSAAPPEMMVTTVTSDRPFKLDSEGQALSAVPDEASQLLPLINSELRVTYQLPVRAEGNNDGKRRSWRLADIALDQREEVRRALEEDRGLHDLIANMVHFMILQRVFRAALEGNLGPNFPHHRLVELAQITSPTFRIDVPTPRWENRGGRLERGFAKLLRTAIQKLESDPGVPRAALTSFARCADLIERQNQDPLLAQISEDQWNQSCDFGSAEKLAATLGTAESTLMINVLLQRADIIVQTRRLRHALMVDADLPRGAERRECPEI